MKNNILSIVLLAVLGACSEAPPTGTPDPVTPEPQPSAETEYPEAFTCRDGPPQSVTSTGCSFWTFPTGEANEPAVAVMAEINGDVDAFYASRGELDVATVETFYAGTMTGSGHSTLSPNRLELGFCYNASSIYTPEPCTIELLELERGELISEGTGDEPLQIERGSRVRLRVECPEEGLYTPGADDYLPTRQQFSPHEFELEASDCEVR